MGDFANQTNLSASMYANKYGKYFCWLGNKDSNPRYPVQVTDPIWQTNLQHNVKPLRHVC